jgi:tetratricopeptide (TPR) repeat protein
MAKRPTLYTFMLIVFVLFGLLCSSITRGYSAEDPDSLTITRNLIQQGKFHGAYHVIKLYAQDHPDDFNTTWLFAYTSYFARHFIESDRLYLKAMMAAPANYYLRLDYARMLVNIGYYNQAKPLLQSYLSYEPMNGTALITLSRLYYYEANYKKALSTLSKIGVKSDEFQYVSHMKQEIKLASTPWISVRFGYATDDQPLKGYIPEIKAGWSLHPLATVLLTIQTLIFLNDNSSTPGFWGQAGNKMFFAKPRVNLDFNIGLLRFPKKKSVTLTGDLSLRKTFLRNLELNIRAERSPYFSTTSSIDSSIMENHLSLAMGWTDMNSLNGNITAEVRNYPFDKNIVFSLNGWALGPPLAFSVFKLWFGVGYNYSTSRQNNFVAEKSLAKILSDYNSTTQIKGIYNPYFTPKDQHLASFIVAFAIHPAKILDFNVNMNLGVCSFAMIPYLYLDKNSSGVIYIARDFSRETYFPARVTASLGLKLAPNIRLQADYDFNSTYYYVRHSAGLGLKINLTNGNR